LDRQNRLHELVTSEEHYQQYLLILRDRLKAGLEEEGLISKQEGVELFPNIDGMVVLSGMIRDQFR
jgi:hypothetical protein